jgi:hypothetical protein
MTRIPPPWEQTFECRDESCKHGWAIKKVTSPPVNAYIIHAPKEPKKVKDGEVRRCSTFLVFSPSPEQACAAMGLDGDRGEYEFVDCYELMALWDRTNEVLKERGPDGPDHSGGIILGGG